LSRPTGLVLAIDASMTIERMNRTLGVALVCMIAACKPGAAPSNGGTDPDVEPLAQEMAPVDAIGVWVNGFHLYSEAPEEQVEANHYVTELDNGVMQALVFDGTGKDARLIGVEYILPAEQYASLPDDEKRLWHSHVHEAKSGLLVAPGMPANAERELMTKLVSSYGKTWHMWHTDRNMDLPTGVPTLMVSALADGQIDPAKIAERDARLLVDSAEIAKSRADLPTPEIDPLADSWARGEPIKLEIVEE
jgi:hypothetical protein